MKETIKYNRRSTRLKNYDYSREGHYFITICTQDKLHLFGEIVDEVMVLGVAGEMMVHWYSELENKFKHIKNHEMIIMPNHIHFIMEIVGADLCVRPNVDAKMFVRPNMDENKMTGMQHKRAETQSQRAETQSQRADTQVRPYVGDVVQWFKTMTTNGYIKMVKNGTTPPFKKRIWQRNYYEHVIRDDVDYNRIATYIINNPMTWGDDVLSKNEYP